ncbi:hypothetical protein B0H19DRAFT_1082987 [Mycena capillaripes]|nr:hypothetical protein B0H19DRAFT_1082987 [Mycena capillaripes]
MEEQGSVALLVFGPDSAESPSFIGFGFSVQRHKIVGRLRQENPNPQWQPNVRISEDDQGTKRLFITIQDVKVIQTVLCTFDSTERPPSAPVTRARSGMFPCRRPRLGSAITLACTSESELNNTASTFSSSPIALAPYPPACAFRVALGPHVVLRPGIPQTLLIFPLFSLFPPALLPAACFLVPDCLSSKNEPLPHRRMPIFLCRILSPRCPFSVAQCRNVDLRDEEWEQFQLQLAPSLKSVTSLTVIDRESGEASGD